MDRTLVELPEPGHPGIRPDGIPKGADSPQPLDPWGGFGHILDEESGLAESLWRLG